MTNDTKPATSAHVDEEKDDRIIGVALRWSLALFVGVVLVAAIVYFATRKRDDGGNTVDPLAPATTRDLSKVEIPLTPFVDVTADAGIEFTHENGATGEKLLPETMGGGVAFWDFNNDSHPDILFVNSQRWPEDRRDEPAMSKLCVYQNDGTGHFTDVTEELGLDISLYGMGAAIGDYDNDGYVDLYITTVFANVLFHNEAGKRFVDVTVDAGVSGDDDRWSSSAGWFDYDNDGDLDLMVCNYLEWSREYDLTQDFRLTGGGRAYGRPANFEGVLPYLFKNEGDGKFEDVTEEAGLNLLHPDSNAALYKSLGVTFADFDQDHRIDVMIANDTVPNILLHNQGNGTFADVASLAGVAVDQDKGNARAGMGLAVGAFRNSQEMGIIIGNFANEMTALYVSNDGELQFIDEAMSSGMGPNTRLDLTFGVLFADYDLDGRLDLFAANGHLEKDVNIGQPSQHYAQPPQLFWNCGVEQDTEFAPVRAEHVGDAFLQPIVGRGTACADIDADGDLDFLIGTVGGKPRLLRNDQELGHSWIRLKLQGTSVNRDAIGSWVTIPWKGGVIRRQVMPTCSYQSQSELPLTIGLGDATELPSLTITWADGTTQVVEDLELNKSHVIEQQ